MNIWIFHFRAFEEVSHLFSRNKYQKLTVALPQVTHVLHLKHIFFTFPQNTKFMYMYRKMISYRYTNDIIKSASNSKSANEISLMKSSEKLALKHEERMHETRFIFMDSRISFVYLPYTF